MHINQLQWMIVITLAGTAPLLAQERSPDLDDIIVTARKHEESLQNIPVAVSAFSADTISAMGVADLEQLSKESPGLSVSNQGSGFGGRFLSGIFFRGMYPTNLTPSFQVGALFVDGVFFLGGAQSIVFDDVQRVEVIRGPQAAYFGRSTFGGAINYITRDPTNDFHGKVDLDYSPTYGSFGASSSLEGSILDDKLGLRLSASTRQKGAEYTATDGGELGAERTDTVAGTFVFKPNDRLKLKFRASYSQDDDGPPTITTFSFTHSGNCGVGTPVSFYNTQRQLVQGHIDTPFQCGSIPFGQPITSITAFPTASFPSALFLGAPAGSPLFSTLNVRQTLVSNVYGSELLSSAPSLDRIGLIRETERFALSGDYTLNDAITISGNAGFNKQDANDIRDGSNSDTPSTFEASPYTFTDYSGEFRIRFDDRGPLRAGLGVNYYKQKVDATYANAIEATYGFDLGGGLIARPYPLSNPAANYDRITTKAVFGSIDYDLMPWLTATLEGRYQDDTVARFGGSQDSVVPLPQSIDAKKFLPRAILSARPNDATTVYVSYAVGTLPGDINSNIATLTASDLALAKQLLGTIPTTVPAQTLDSYELGFKQTLFGSLRYSLTTYLMNWDNQASSAAVFLPTNRTTDFTVTGNSRIEGIEFESAWAATRRLELGAEAEYTHARYIDFKLPGDAVLFGADTTTGYNAKGNTLPHYPVWKGSTSATWTDHLIGDWTWFTRGDGIYTGKQFTDETNLNWLPGYAVFNLHLGAYRSDGLRVEAFATNLLGKQAWGSGFGGFDLSLSPVIELPNAPGVSPPTTLIPRGAQVTPIDRREIGVRASYKF